VLPAAVAPTIVIECVKSPVGEIQLSRRGRDFAIHVDGVDLMDSKNHQSEDELGQLAGDLVRHVGRPRILIGGLGLGYTLRAALDTVTEFARIDIAEIVPAVVRWNRTILAPLTRQPLADPRVTLIEDDVARVIRDAPGRYDAIVLDVDNGPDGICEDNAALYMPDGLASIRAALAQGGVLVIWSAFDSEVFTKELGDAGFDVEVQRIRTWHGGGGDHFFWVARPRYC
jgi:spermidine synthase